MEAGGRVRERRRAGELESEVLEVLWAAGTAMTPAQVRDAVSGDLAYTTVMTILSRLHDKGAARRDRHGRAFAYTAIMDEAGLAAARMRASVEGHPDRDAVLARFVDGLSDDDEKTLRTLLAEATERDRRR